MIFRIPYFDALRGLAITLVVLIHGYGYCYAYPDVPMWTIGFRNVLNVAVPLFLAISGYFLASKDMDNGGYGAFLFRQIPRVYIPMLFCSLPLFFIGIFHGGRVAPFISLFSCSYSVYYFIAVIIQCYLLLPVLQKSNLKLWLVATAILGIGWLGFYSYFFSLYLGKSLPLILYAGHFFMWGFFFIFGIYFKKKGLPKLSFKKIIPLIILALAASILESCYIMDETQSMRGCGQKISVFVLNILLIISLFHSKIVINSNKIERFFVFRFFVLLGKFSFGVYLIHLYVLKQIYLRLTWIDIQSLKWVIGTIIAFALLCFAFFYLYAKKYRLNTHVFCLGYKT